MTERCTATQPGTNARCVLVAGHAGAHEPEPQEWAAPKVTVGRCQATSPDGTERCVFVADHAGAHMTGTQYEQSIAPRAPITRTYRGSPEQAGQAMAEDAAKLSQQFYFPVSQAYTPGAYGCGAFLLALLLAIVLIGILIFIYMLLVKPPGTLLVTYEYRPRLPAVAA